MNIIKIIIDSNMYPIMKMVKTQHPDTEEYPTNTGKAWTDEEESTLLRELEQNINIEIIAQTHKRTIGGIKGRQQTIAYKLYQKNVPMETIMTKTKLNKEQILETIKKKEKNVKISQEQNIVQKQVSLENEIFELKSEIKELKNTIKELVDMMKAVYEFEDAV